MVQIPQGVVGWEVFIFGLIIIGFRAAAIFQPRSWVEWVERQFIYKKQMQLIGFICFAIAITLPFFGEITISLLGLLFFLSILFLFLLGPLLIFARNIPRTYFVAESEMDDNSIKYISIGTTVLGLLWALAPWFF
jgi:hypothetical protein